MFIQKKLFNILSGYIFYSNVYTLDCCLLYCTIHFRVLKYLLHYSSLFCAQFCTTLQFVALDCTVLYDFILLFCPDLWNCKSFLQGQGYTSDWVITPVVFLYCYPRQLIQLRATPATENNSMKVDDVWCARISLRNCTIKVLLYLLYIKQDTPVASV